MKSPQDWLKAEYLRRRKKNPSYSLRAFSRLLGISSGRVSQLLNGRRQFTVSTGKKIVSALAFSEGDQAAFLKSIDTTRRKRKSSAQNSKVKGLATVPESRMRKVASTYAAVISDPMHFAILSLMETDDFRSDSPWIANRLGLSTLEVRDILLRLKESGLVKTDEDGELVLASPDGVRTSCEVPSQALRRAQKKILSDAKKSLDEIQLQLRDITAITLATDPAKLDEAKELVKEFRRKMAAMLESGEKKEVYRLCVQLYPVSKLRN